MELGLDRADDWERIDWAEDDDGSPPFGPDVGTVDDRRFAGAGDGFMLVRFGLGLGPSTSIQSSLIEPVLPP